MFFGDNLPSGESGPSGAYVGATPQHPAWRLGSGKGPTTVDWTISGAADNTHCCSDSLEGHLDPCITVQAFFRAMSLKKGQRPAEC